MRTNYQPDKKQANHERLYIRATSTGYCAQVRRRTKLTADRAWAGCNAGCINDGIFTSKMFHLFRPVVTTFVITIIIVIIIIIIIVFYIVIVFARLAQLVRSLTTNQKVPGSIPGLVED